MTDRQSRSFAGSLEAALPLPLVALIGVALVLRCHGLHQLPLSHYDEGVYVQNGLNAAFTSPLNFNFELPLHAPPLFPWLLGAIFWVTQIPWPNTGILASAAFGVATIPLVFALARRVAGPVAGFVAAAIVTLSDLHVTFSRAALTDVPLAFWYVLGVYCFVRLAEAHADGKSRSPWRTAFWVLAAGGVTGIAWNTKYNGWMPCATSFVAAMVYVCRPGGTSGPEGALSLASKLRAIAVFAAPAIIAAVIYAPWALHVEESFPGGYAAITAHHRTYIGGLRSWGEHAYHQLLTLGAFRHWGWVGSLLIATCAIGLRIRDCFADRWSRTLAVAVGGGAAVSMLAHGTDTMLILVASASLPAWVASRSLPKLLLATWCAAFVLLVPLYYPYSRLLVPLVPASACVVAVVLVRALETAAQDSSGRRRCRAALVVATVAGSLLVIAGRPFGLIPGPELWQRWSARQSYQTVTDMVLAHTEPEAFVLCQAQPPLALYVPRDRLPLGNVPFTSALDRVHPNRPCYLALDFFWLHAQPEDTALAAIMQNADQLELVASVENQLGVFTLADFMTPSELARKVSRSAVKDEAAGLKVPPALDDGGQDFIGLYRITRRR